MSRTVLCALLGAAALAAASEAGASTVFSNDFSAGIGPSEALVGNFTVANGYVGHHGLYANNEYSSYRITVDLKGMTNAVLTFDYDVQTERTFDYLQVLANDVVLQSYSGYGAAHAQLTLDALTDPALTGPSMISFDFHSDFADVYPGVLIDNVVVSADGPAAPVSVPEPGSWAAMVVGLGLLGLGRRRGIGQG